VVLATTPRERGRFFGLRIVWFGTGGLLGGVFAARALHALETPLNFGLSIAVGGALILLATAWFSLYRDDAGAETAPRPSLVACLTDVWEIARRRRTFLIFLLAASLFVLAQGPFAFLALFIKERLQADDTLLGRLSAVFAVCSMTLALATGYAGDRFGHRTTFQWGLIAYAGGLALALAGHTPPVLFTAYFVASTSSPVWQVAAFNLALECSGEKDAARVYAGLSLVSAPLRIVGPLGAGAGIDRWGYSPVIAGALLLSLAGWALSVLWLRTPWRKEQDPL
jgi:Na+/melibiose symporter-like transporter